MLVALLQMMGFPATKAVHSRAEGTGAAPASRAGEPKRPPLDHRVSVRSPAVKAIKASPSKAKASPIAKPKAKATPVAAAPSKAKPAVKVPVKAAPKAAPAAKKPAATTAKTPVKTPAKAPGKAAAKAVVKPSPAQKATVSSAAVKKAPYKTTPATPPAAVVDSSTKAPVNSSPSKAVPAAPAPVAASTVPVKSGRPSSRLAMLTVPSMAQSVASTAAKASFNPSSQAIFAPPVIPAIVKKDSKLANNWKTTPVERLTDAELLAMPDSEYMNEVQLAAFKLKLNVLKREILSSAGETTEHLREDTSVVPDPADRATIEEEHALELRTRDRERKLLKKIEQSIARIDAGDYGYCDETGEAIGVGRLLARPTATLSLEAQQRRELKQKMFGD
jgi:DnaK suppressor protein